MHVRTTKAGSNVNRFNSTFKHGDQLKPAHFQLRLDGITKSVVTAFNVLVLNDSTIGDSLEKYIENVNHILQNLKLAGLELSSSK